MHIDQTINSHGGFNRLAIVNQKGGVGKTTTTINLATAFAALQRRVLVIDLDPQGNASTGLGVPKAQRVRTTYDVLMGAMTMQQAIVPTQVPGLSLVPSDINLTGAELELVDQQDRAFCLRKRLSDVSSDYDNLLIDCPPSLGLLTLNAMAAVNALLIPLQCEFFALEGLSQLMETVDRVKQNFNPSLEIEGVLLTMYDQRNKLSSEVAADVRAHFGPKVYNTIIPRNVRISEAPSHGKPVLLYDHRSSGARAYMRLVKEICEKERRVITT